jgi:ABC-type antimicrobial peptide transport system permease subunit
VRAIPGIASVGVIDHFALGGGTSFSGITVDGKSEGTTVFRATPGYFTAIDARLKAGRFPTDEDYTSGRRWVIVSETAENALFDGHAVGRDITRAGRDQAPWTVIGVMRDLKHGGPLSTRTEPEVFFSLIISEYDLNTAMMVIMRPSSRLPGLADQLRRVAASVGPRVLIERIRTSEDFFGDRVITPRRRNVLLGLLGGLGMALALVGVFGMTAYSVTRRTAEIGVRLAFGARPGQVVRTMLRDSAIPIAIGTIVGAGGSLLASRTIESFLFATAPTDPATLVAVSVTLATTGLLAALVPAMRAAKVDPASCLRTD